MKAHKALRAILFTFILTVGFLLPALTSTPVFAESNSGQTTLYFTDALNSTANLSDFNFAFVSQTPPIKQNDSQYPPSLFIKNTSKPLQRYSFNADQWLTWFSSAWLLYFLENSSDFNLSDFGGIFGNLELFLPSPYRVVEGYTYNGNDSVKINGDFFYNLYFTSPIKNTKFRDHVKVGLYSMNMNSALPLPKQINNTTIELTPEFFSDIYNQQITLKNINYTLQPGDSLLFTVEIVPSNKTLPTLLTKYIDLNRFITRWENIASRWENRSNMQKLQDIGTTLKDILSILKESNITSEDFAALINSMRSSSFVYDSVNHPASVTIPAKISEEDIRVYYLHTIPEMNENLPETKNGSIELTEKPTLWTTEPFDRNKILKMGDISADLYFDYYQILNIFKGKITITTTVYDNDTTIASSEIELDKPKILEILAKPNKPVTFSFSGSDKEISYGHSIKFGVFLKNGTSATVKLLYDSSNYPSALRVKLEETQNIKITNITSIPPNKKIIPGGTVEYILNVTSEKTDTLQISSNEREKTGDWEITVPNSATVLANNWTYIHVFLKSLINIKEAYGNTITLNIIISGNTGIARKEVSAEVSKDAIHYDVEILKYSHIINISKGENRTFYFVIKNNNTGAIDDVDNYTISVSSKNLWPLIARESIRNLRRGDSTATDDARVVIQVPKNTTLDSDIITITVASDGDPSTTTTINVTVHVIGEGFLESIYNLFDSAAGTLGLNEMFGSYGTIVLASILMVIILFLLIILALVFTTKHVRIICTDRIKEIDATEKAIFELTLQNPIKKTQSYEILAQQTSPSSKWMIAVDPLTTTINGRQSKTIQIIVTPTNNNESKDWTQVTVHVKKTGKKKTENITLIAMIKEGKTLLKLDNVSHWPTVFNPREKVTTFCSISNNGTVSAPNVNVFFYLNGKQKNIVKVTIPAGNVADLEIPWIAVKGKNKVRIRVKEQ
jgi:uncharacterized membrane protein